MVSGPIIKDKLWFFFATETHLIQRGRGSDVEGILPDPTLYQKGIQKGTFKITWQISPRNRLTNLNNFDSAYESNQRNELGIAPEAQQNRWDHRNFESLIWESMLTRQPAVPQPGRLSLVPLSPVPDPAVAPSPPTATTSPPR